MRTRRAAAPTILVHYLTGHSGVFARCWLRPRQGASAAAARPDASACPRRIGLILHGPLGTLAAADLVGWAEQAVRGGALQFVMTIRPVEAAPGPPRSAPAPRG